MKTRNDIGWAFTGFRFRKVQKVLGWRFWMAFLFMGYVGYAVFHALRAFDSNPGAAMGNAADDEVLFAGAYDGANVGGNLLGGGNAGMPSAVAQDSARAAVMPVSH